jgi:hypothetical protein
MSEFGKRQVRASEIRNSIRAALQSGLDADAIRSRLDEIAVRPHEEHIVNDEIQDQRRNVARQVREHERQAKELREMEAFLHMAKGMPHPAWIERMPKAWREMAIKDHMSRGGDMEEIEQFDRVVRAFIDRKCPIFTVSRELESLIEKCDLDPALPCSYVKSPTPGGCYFYTPYSNLQDEAGAKIQGFYVLTDAAGVSLSFVVGEGDMQWTIDIEHGPNSVATNLEPSKAVSAKAFEAYSFAIMLLFYCNSSQYRSEDRPEYSLLSKEAEAKKNPAKKRSLQQRASSKFDYILISPAASHTNSQGAGGERSPHFRRGHFRMQKWGPRLSMEKMIFIEPCFVGGAAKIKNYVVD